MGLDRKRNAVERLGCDVLVVPECNSEPVHADELGVSFAWKGRYPIKGLGVFAFGSWRLEPAEEVAPLPWVLPLRPIDPSGVEAALLLAMWTVANASDKWPSYSAQVRVAIDAWESELREGTVILAGDRIARPRGRQRRLIWRTSASSTSSAFDPPTTPTCDFVFLSAPLAGRLEDVRIGGMDEWVESGLSDHAPVVVRLGSESEITRTATSQIS